MSGKQLARQYYEIRFVVTINMRLQATKWRTVRFDKINFDWLYTTL